MAHATTTASKPNFRTNKDQQVNFFGHGVHTVKYMGKCPVSGIRCYDMPGSPYPDHDYVMLEAAQYGMTGPDFMISYLASNDSAQCAKGLELAKKTWFPGPDMVGEVTKVVVRAATYFDKVNGNPYFKATVYANGQKVLVMPRQYGGGKDQIAHEAANELHKAGYITLEQYSSGASESANRWADRNGASFGVQLYAATYREFYNLGIYAE